MISDEEFLRMVGLDGYMYIRYIAACFKISCFLFFMGSIVLLPVYSLAGGTGEYWNTYTLSNIPDEGSAQFWVIYAETVLPKNIVF